MAQTREQRLRQMAEINRRRRLTDPEFNERKAAYMRQWHAAQRDADPDYLERKRQYQRKYYANHYNADGSGNDGRVKVLPDETVWFGLLGGARYQDHPAAVAPEPPLRMLPAASLTAHSSLAWSA